jgi:hypothetical protein
MWYNLVYQQDFMQYNKLTRRAWSIAIVLFIVTLGAVFFKMRNAPDTIALRYNIIIGVNEIGNKYELLKIPLTGLVIGAVNFALIRFQKFDRQFLPLLAAMATVGVNAFLLLSVLFLFKVS